MLNIRTYNNISDIIYDYLPKDRFAVADSGDDYAGILVRSADLNETEFPASTLAIARAGAGVNNIPIERCSQQGIAVFNTPGANANAVRELVMCGLLLSGRKVLEGAEWLLEQKAAGATGLEKLAEKAKSQFVGHELKGKKLGVIGLGAIGVLVANAARNGLDMEVIGYDPYLSVDAALHLTRSVRRASSLDEIYRECDYISLHLPLNDKTKNMISAKQLEMMPHGAVVLNFSRGGLVNIPDLMAALESGQISRFITDFAADEIVGLPGVICLPHLGASTPESEENCAAMAAQELRDYLLHGTIHNSVNLPECELARNGSGCRLALLHRNQPNMISQIAALLSAEKLNIDHMVNNSRGDWAYTLIDLDITPSQQLIEQLNGIGEMVKIRVI